MSGPEHAGQPGPRRVVIALGSNLGDRLGNLQGGMDAVLATPGISFETVSPVYATAPVGGPDQPDYYNAVLIVTSARSAREILARCQAVETAFGRVRLERWGPRTLDLDIIVYGDEVSDDPELTLPHPRAHERAFVLVPWRAADPEATLPSHGRVADLLATVGSARVSLVPDAVLRPST